MARGRIFADPKKKEEMLILRIKNYSYERIADKYGVDHTTIIYHCQQAGIALPEKVKDQMYEFLSKGVPFEDISSRLSVSMEVINLYISIYGVDGKKVFSRRVLQKRANKGILKTKPVKRSAIKIEPIWWVMAKKIKPIVMKIPSYVSTREPKPIEELVINKPITKVDERGVDWLADNKGGWICLGMSEEGQRRADMERKRRQLDVKRLQMLSY